ncbi:MAG: hypothetical protein IPK83_23315 [Planctomycetes bacterium]|nr:hypothetical protein [Planctomycetota bacterium]
MAEFFGEFGEFDEDFGEFVALAWRHAFVDGFGDAGEHSLFGSLHEEEVADFLADDGENEAGGQREALGRAGEDVGELFEHCFKCQKVNTSKSQNGGIARGLRLAGAVFRRLNIAHDLGFVGRIRQMFGCGGAASSYEFRVLSYERRNRQQV